MGTMGRRRNKLDTEDGIGKTRKLMRKRIHKVQKKVGIGGNKLRVGTRNKWKERHREETNVGSEQKNVNLNIRKGKERKRM